MPKVTKPAGTRNFAIARGVLAFSKSTNQDNTGRWRFANKGGPKKAPKAKAPLKLDAGKFYPADNVPQPLRRLFKPKSTKLRASITPGTVLIVLAGRFQGKRVVFLKQLASGLLLVTGPYKVNGVPLRRLNQAYVIATSKKVDVSGVALPETVNDSFFVAENGKDRSDFFSTDAPKAVVIPDARKKVQKDVDNAIISKLDKLTSGYLGARFTLSKGEFPHQLKF